MSDITSIRKNPWINLPKTRPYILAEDLRALRENLIKPHQLGLHLGILPVPYLGHPNKAKVVLLCLNPGYRRKLDRKAYKDKYCFKEDLKSFTFSNRIPFRFLDPKLEYSGGYKWWTRLFKRLIRKFGMGALSKKLMCLQYLPYHSKTFKKPPCILPSQNYTFFLLRKAIKRKKVIVIMRSKKLWFEAVPELKSYPFIELKNYRMPYLTARNTKNGDFRKLIKALRP